MLTSIPHRRAFWVDQSMRRAHSKPAPKPMPKPRRDTRHGLTFGDARRLYGALPPKFKPASRPFFTSASTKMIPLPQIPLLAEWSTTTAPLVRAVYRKNKEHRAATLARMV